MSYQSNSYILPFEIKTVQMMFSTSSTIDIMILKTKWDNDMLFNKLSISADICFQFVMVLRIVRIQRNDYVLRNSCVMQTGRNWKHS